MGRLQSALQSFVPAGVADAIQCVPVGFGSALHGHMLLWLLSACTTHAVHPSILLVLQTHAAGSGAQAACRLSAVCRLRSREEDWRHASASGHERVFLDLTDARTSCVPLIAHALEVCVCKHSARRRATCDGLRASSVQAPAVCINACRPSLATKGTFGSDHHPIHLWQSALMLAGCQHWWARFGDKRSATCGRRCSPGGAQLGATS